MNVAEPDLYTGLRRASCKICGDKGTENTQCVYIHVETSIILQLGYKSTFSNTLIQSLKLGKIGVYFE